MRHIIIAAILLLTSTATAQETDQPESTHALIQRTSVTASSYMVSAAHPLATRAGYDVLASGGTAADAAVAIQIMLNLVEPQSSGIGGGAFALYWDSRTKSLTSWDGRETAPLAATPDYWLDPDGDPIGWSKAVVGGRSVGVPGTLKLLETLHKNYAAQEWASLFTPTITRAEQGFAISPRMAASIAQAADFDLTKFPKTRAYLFDQQGRPWPAGHNLKNPNFATVLRLIAAKGSAPFYTGDVATDIIKATRTVENTGILTAQDFADYTVKKRPPVCVPYRGYDICGMGPPSSGGLTVGQVLKQLEPFDLTTGFTASNIHLIAESSKLAFADRGLYMADSDFVDMPTKGLTSSIYLATRSALINPAKAMPKASAGDPPWDETNLFAPDMQPEGHGTSHFSVVDSFGNMISMTTTIETGFGSRLMTHGFLLNNELTDFSRRPSRDGKSIANRVEGGKRPRSSMAPTIVLKDGRPVLLTGSPGGSRIIGYTAQSIIAILDWQMDPQVAIDLPHVVNRNGPTDIEEGPSAANLASKLQALGHKTRIRNLNSGLHLIQITKDTLIGGADKRREGLVLGN